MSNPSIESQIADTLGELDRYSADTHSPDTRVKALSARLRHLEQRRHHQAALTQEGHVRGEMLSAVNDIAKDLRVVVERYHETPDKTVFETRAMGTTFRLVGDKDDPNFQHLLKMAEEAGAALAAARVEAIKHDSTEDAKDREHQRDMERELGAG